ncbi:MAG: hypothetical protein ACT4O2_16510 [Beijerinckiaceae bacterium]
MDIRGERLTTAGGGNRGSAAAHLAALRVAAQQNPSRQSCTVVVEVQT